MQPPNNLEAEQSVLGAILLDNSVLIDIQTILTEEDFYYPQNKAIYQSMLELQQKRHPIDIITLSGEDNSLLPYLVEIQNKTPTSANSKYYTNIVKAISKQRKLIRLCQETMSKAATCENIESEIETLNKNLQDINQNLSSEYYTFDEVIESTFKVLKERCENKGKSTGVVTGFKDLDYKLGGLQKGSLYIIAARPSMGKTAFVENITTQASIKDKYTTAFFSLEMTKEQIALRKFSAEGLIDNTKFKLGELTQEDKKKIVKVSDEMKNSPLIIDDTACTTLLDIESKCRKIKNTYGKLELVVIDYLQLITSTRKTGSREQEVSEISRSLKLLAKDLNCPVICLSQLSRAPEQRTDHRPILSDLRESGAIEQDADVVIFLYRDDYYNPETDKKNIAEVIIAKGRETGTGVVELAWLGQYTKFANLETKLSEIDISKEPEWVQDAVNRTGGIL